MNNTGDYIKTLGTREKIALVEYLERSMRGLDSVEQAKNLLADTMVRLREELKDGKTKRGVS